VHLARHDAGPRRPASTWRASDARLAEINEVAAIAGHDPSLDTLLLRVHTKPRAGGEAAR
jgi:hypothetical protein